MGRKAEKRLPKSRKQAPDKQEKARAGLQKAVRIVSGIAAVLAFVRPVLRLAWELWAYIAQSNAQKKEEDQHEHNSESHS